ncbi:tetratricopeptide repeat protein [Streptomyces sp. NPDC001450]
MSGGQEERAAALSELRARMEDALARQGLNKTMLVARTGLGRTTVSEAFKPDGPVPSAATVAALSRALRLPELELLELRRASAGAAAVAVGRTPGPGKPIGQWDPHDLEVHPAGAVLAGRRMLPGYVRRIHDQALVEAVRDVLRDRSRLAILVGNSSTGKTRSCWEAVQPLAEQGWMLWHPFDPTRADAALEDLVRVQPRTVVWLNDAQHYLGDARLGEQIAAAVHALITDSLRGPVLVLGTLWPAHAEQYTALPSSGGWDRHSRARELIAGRTLAVPDSFDAKALKAAVSLAEGGDRLLADALARRGADGRVTQELAGAPELLRRYQQAGPPVRAVLEAAMDARRLGVGLHLPKPFLTEAAIDYLSDDDLGDLTEDWAEAAFADLARPVHGRQAPLGRAVVRPERRPPSSQARVTASGPPAEMLLRLADYLEQHGRTARRFACPPASFWHAAQAHLTDPADLNALAAAAFARYRLQWSDHLRRRAADAGSATAMHVLALMCQDSEERVALLQRGADAGSTEAVCDLVMRRANDGDLEGAEGLAQRFAATAPAGLELMSDVWRVVGDPDGEERILRQAADVGYAPALSKLALLRDTAGDRSGAEAFARQAAAAGVTSGLRFLAIRRQSVGDRDSAQMLYRLAADAGDIDALCDLMKMRANAGDLEGAAALAQQAAANGQYKLLVALAVMRAKAGDRDGAETLYRQAADAGNLEALRWLAEQREEAGDLDAALAFYRQAAVVAPSSNAPHRLVSMLEEAGDRSGAEAAARQAAEAGEPSALRLLARMREVGDDRNSAEDLRRQAADHGDPLALAQLAQIHTDAGDHDRAEALYRQIADAGEAHTFLPVYSPAGSQDAAEAADQDFANDVKHWAARWPYGLDPDGSPSPPWE